ncbi:uncharacterized protein LOC124264606 [Haliotis rubra]|uniref:uncharacterized protein LOC124264606 n=1 Tax=Haliotis rubra TaxID=36100 RepID=UPI001EE5D9DC|nr:uncharacterized protein LOC124264606 [Haliotis rubra]
MSGVYYFSEGPTCYITSDKNASLLSEGDTLTLTVNLSRSDCPQSLLLQLRTGNISSVITTDTDIEDGTLTKVFNVTSSHAGEVSLIYNCSGSSWNLLCEGIKRLVLGKQANIMTTPPQLTGHPTTDGQDTDSSQPRMILGIIFAVVVIVIAPVTIIITIFVVKRWKKGKHRNKKHDEDDTDTKLTS